MPYHHHLPPNMKVNIKRYRIKPKQIAFPVNSTKRYQNASKLLVILSLAVTVLVSTAWISNYRLNVPSSWRFGQPLRYQEVPPPIISSAAIATLAPAASSSANKRPPRLCTIDSLTHKVHEIDGDCINPPESASPTSQNCPVPKQDYFQHFTVLPTEDHFETDPTVQHAHSLFANKIILLIGDSQDRYTLETACNMIPSDSPNQNGTIYVTDAIGRLLVPHNTTYQGDTRICVVKRHGETIVFVTLFHFGVEMVDMFDPSDLIGFPERSNGGVFWQRVSHRIRILPWVLHNIARECFPDLVAKLGKNILELPKPTYDIRFSQREIDNIRLEAAMGDQDAKDLMKKYKFQDWKEGRTMNEDSVYQVIGWPIRHHPLPFWYPKPSLIVAQSSLWDIWSWQRGGELMNDTDHLNRLHGGKWKQNFHREILGPVREVFPRSPLVLRTSPIPTDVHSPVVVSAINFETKAIAVEEGLRVLDWGALPVGNYDGYHADEA
ncbi:hypothetical protein HDU76_009455, partial [Blyttiomyces sp. JEL0837]